MQKSEKKTSFAALLAATVLFAVAAPASFALGGSDGKTEAILDDSRFMLDTIVSIRLYGSDDETALEGAFGVIEDYENLLSRHRVGSDVSRINDAPAGTAVPAAPETLEVLGFALKYADLSGGAFDPTVGPLVDLWGIGTDAARVPEPEEIDRVLGRIDYRQVSMDAEGGTVALGRPGMSLDLGGVAKGWIADETARYLRGEGQGHFLINLGGNILVSGGKPDGKPFRIGMQDPYGETGRYLGIFEVSDRAVVSSGVYERFFEQDGIRYHHILNTKNGYPVRNGLAAVTVLTSLSADGDALSTTLFALGLEEGSALARGLDDVEAAFITEDGAVYMTEGAAAIFEPTVPGLEVEVLRD